MVRRIFQKMSTRDLSGGRGRLSIGDWGGPGPPPEYRWREKTPKYRRREKVLLHHCDGVGRVGGPADGQHDVDADHSPEGEFGAADVSEAPEDAGADGGDDEFEEDEAWDEVVLEHQAGDGVELVEGGEEVGPDGEEEVREAEEPQDGDEVEDSARAVGFVESEAKCVWHIFVRFPSMGESARGGADLTCAK